MYIRFEPEDWWQPPRLPEVPVRDVMKEIAARTRYVSDAEALETFEDLSTRTAEHFGDMA